MMRHQLPAALYAPLRVVPFEDEQGRATSCGLCRSSEVASVYAGRAQDELTEGTTAEDAPQYIPEFPDGTRPHLHYFPTTALWLAPIPEPTEACSCPRPDPLLARDDVYAPSTDLYTGMVKVRRPTTISVMRQS
jgi:hypothetical protein